ncbi:hypothetical protein G6O69_35410 [Pseudenhygromyxa sp. WMMC2535]|uniref:hypothetical protein n=1 Tax=Pseudenhygromyxa sp. WMMC2535 TaxID=2712867 RepID=UPI001595510D|nr:hypothetical protein [Pseudenhygromyxa sp. WMMC2535]NVB43166.1 hypothetical protein [Pseudenhygromyxa sp. WMMC2535]
MYEARSSRLVTTAIVIAAAFGSSTACVTVDGVVVREKKWESHEAKVRALAVYRLECEPQDIETTLVEATAHSPTKISVEGCDQQRTYARSLRAGYTWQPERP